MIAAIVFTVLLVALGWLLVGGRERAPEPTAHRRVDEAIDYTELEQAEREVRDAPDEERVRDWGPGVQKPPIV